MVPRVNFEADASLAELILDHLATPHGILIHIAAYGQFETILVAGLGEQLLRFLRIVGIHPGDVLVECPVRARQRHARRFAKAVERRLDESIAVEREVDRLTDLDVVERCAAVIEVDLNAIQCRRADGFQILGALDHRLQSRRQLERHIVLAGDDRTQGGSVFRNDVEFDAVEIGPALAPVLIMAGDDDDLVVVPAYEFPRPGADRLAVGLIAERLDIGRRHHHAGTIRQNGRQRGVRDSSASASPAAGR